MASGWPTVKTPGEVVPMVGWKVVHPSTVTTPFIFYISISFPNICNVKFKNIIEWVLEQCKFNLC
jgi:hypothetical protein